MPKGTIDRIRGAHKIHAFIKSPDGTEYYAHKTADFVNPPKDFHVGRIVEFEVKPVQNGKTVAVTNVRGAA